MLPPLHGRRPHRAPGAGALLSRHVDAGLKRCSHVFRRLSGRIGVVWGSCLAALGALCTAPLESSHSWRVASVDVDHRPTHRLGRVHLGDVKGL